MNRLSKGLTPMGIAAASFFTIFALGINIKKNHDRAEFKKLKSSNSQTKIENILLSSDAKIKLATDSSTIKSMTDSALFKAKQALKNVAKK